MPFSMKYYLSVFDLIKSILKVSGNGTIPGRLEVFEDAGLRDILNDNIRKANYTVPTPIQRYCIPTIMAGRDMMGCAQTGSGKTVSCIIIDPFRT